MTSNAYQLPEVSEVQTRLNIVRDRIRSAGGDPSAVAIVGVTKGLPAEIVGVALDVGLAELGENYAQELVAKAAWLAEHRPNAAVQWQFIGRVQRNKVRVLSPIVALWQSVDRQAVLDEVAHRAPGARVLVQVNTTGEPQKAGCDPLVIGSLLEHGSLLGLHIVGLMTVGPTDQSIDPRPGFARLRTLVDQHGLDRCSMGMTEDLEAAVAEGSNMVRIGRALFGPRPS